MPDIAAQARARAQAAPPHTPVLTDAQKATYQERGYVVVRDAFDRALHARLAERTRRLVARSASMTAPDRHFDLAPEHAPDAPTLRRISSPTELDPVFIEVAFESNVGDMAADLIGGAVKFYHSKINFKLPGVDSAQVQWHQDWTHFPHTNSNLLAVTLPYQARTRENGCIRVVPGSHRNGPLSVWRDGRYVFTCEHGMTARDFDAVEHVEMAPGDVLLHHGLMVHGSAPNPTDELIISFTIQYAAADAFAYTAPVIDSSERNRMVRGAPARFARLEAGLVELPPDFSAGYTSLFDNQDKAQAS